jgi:hypothetical protein
VNEGRGAVVGGDELGAALAQLPISDLLNHEVPREAVGCLDDVNARDAVQLDACVSRGRLSG